ncbi:nucleotidyltransferase domain-containing protein [Deinococcus maricopensis]|uniref:Nucleotidyltransferase n=1 Tax=Deinococcus maricopensis (strain DSM 21211 / LMG 22137 / NRRL B-23946 / LB-34) TaxID=709986 RepID=E8U4N7_DEIML|nr:nucleotidyltransferase domain-containing protein [Deinococcus maricopensis]ADV68902.1 Nucleotidyltransferase [Deinococcus maricopensis DSM 21211]
MTYPPELHTAVATHPYPLVFATVSGAHLYGFPSADSDWDLRGAHLLPARDLLGLHEPAETLEVNRDERIELDLVTHDLGKFARLLLKRNGYVLEQLLSPLVVHTTPAHAALMDLAPRTVTRWHAHHYLGFSTNQWSLLEKEERARVKPLLYAFRTVLTGIHLMRTGTIEANLIALNDTFKLPYLNDLIALKVGGAEKEPLPDPLDRYRAEHARLMADLERARDNAPLPDAVDERVVNALSDLLVRERLATP